MGTRVRYLNMPGSIYLISVRIESSFRILLASLTRQNKTKNFFFFFSNNYEKKTCFNLFEIKNK